MASTRSAPVDFSPETAQNKSQQIPKHKRIFIGPLPERVIALTEGQGKRKPLTLGSVFSLNLDRSESRDVDKSEEVSRLLKEHAYRFFVDRGGHPNNWSEEEENSLTDELLHIWKDSEWGKLWYRRRHHLKEPQNAGDTRWFGTSFEVGTLMGVNILEQQEHITERSAPCKWSKSTSAPDDRPPKLVSTVPGDYVIAPLTFGTSTAPDSGETSKSNVVTEDQASLTPASSRTGLLPSRSPYAKISPAFTRELGKSGVSITSVGNKQSKTDLKGKGKVVRYVDSPSTTREAVPTPGPIPPQQVLERTEGTVDINTSLAATTTSATSEVPPSPSPSEAMWGDVVMRDRMLVKVSYTKSEGLNPLFDENVNRTTRKLSFEDLAEFMVVWRKDSIEIYTDHSTPGKEWATGHKHLAYVIPLKSSRTTLSLYSFVDLTFCITCAPTRTTLNKETARWIFSREKEGTNIFIFKVKSRSRAWDWTWLLWRHMGGQIPDSIDVHNPRLNTKVTIDIPNAKAISNSRLYRFFHRDNVIQLCEDLLRSVPDWKYVLEREVDKGKALQLAWRNSANLDWIWLEEDVLGKPREWAVLCGMAFRQAFQSPTLEIRLAEHAPKHIHLKDGKRFDEPPAIEGYLERIRSNSQTKQLVYLSTHNGNLFLMDEFHAYPPMPPGLAPLSDITIDGQVLRHAEIRRGTNQIMTASAFCDLRTVVVVRRAFHLSPLHRHDQKDPGTENNTSFGILDHSEERTLDDAEDEGGEPGLNKSTDRVKTRMRRSFELLLNTGHVVRFEAQSCHVAIEWIERLRVLMFYWKSRHRTDAKQEIELAQARRPRLTPLTRVCQDDHGVPPEATTDMSGEYAVMDNLYNWCVMEGCGPLVKTGKVYAMKGIRGQYELVQLVLVAGHLVRFRIAPHSAFHSSMRKTVNLLDAYVCSGYFAAQTLPGGQYRPNADPAPRRYQDGLETDDREEDMLFIVWYRSQSQMINADQDPTATAVNTKIPKLSANRKILVFRARSKLERDSWCWAINSEIEKIVRAQKDREHKMRETGNLVKLS